MLPVISTRSSGLLTWPSSGSLADFLSLSSNMTRLIFMEVSSFSLKELPTFVVILKGLELLLSNFRLGLAVF